MTLNDFVNGAKQAVSIISNPNQASVAAAGAAGAFSAEVNNLRKQAIIDLNNFGQKNQVLQTLGVTKFFTGILGGSASNPIPSGGPTILGFSPLTAILGGGAIVILLLLALRRGK